MLLGSFDHFKFSSRSVFPLLFVLDLKTTAVEVQMLVVITSQCE